MSGTTELVQSTIDKVLERVDLLAAKLGIAAKEIWRFSVTAKAVNARAEIAKSAASLLITLILWGWSLHVALRPLPHDFTSEQNFKITESAPMPCDQVGMVNGKQAVLHEMCYHQIQTPQEIRRDTGLGLNGWLLLVSAIITAVLGLVFAGCAVKGVIDGYASTKTAEYDAYQDLIHDWKD